MIIELDKETKLEICKTENDNEELVDSYMITQDWSFRKDVVILDIEAARKLVHEISQDFLRKGV